MDRSGSPQLTRIAGPGRGPGVALAAAAVFLVLAILKPWTAIPGFEAGGSPGTGAGGPNPDQATGSGAAPQRPSASADAVSDLERHCPQPSGWRVFAHERWSGGSVRSWKSLTPARDASGPLDPTIPVWSTERAFSAGGRWTSSSCLPARRRRRRHPAEALPGGEPPQRASGSWLISNAARARPARPIATTYRPGARSGRNETRGPSTMRLATRNTKPTTARAMTTM